MLCLRGEDIVKRMRAILDKNQHDPDQYLPQTSIKSDEPYLAGLGGSYARHLQHGNKAAKIIIEAKNEAGVAFYGEAG